MAPPGSQRRIPEATVTRLPVYQRILHELVRREPRPSLPSSSPIFAHVNASKVSKDLSFLGSFGTRGSGYDTAFLAGQIDRELGLGGDWPVVVVGLGNLGRALANSQGFTSSGFRVAGLFDVHPDLLGTIVARSAGQPRERDRSRRPRVTPLDRRHHGAGDRSPRMSRIGSSTPAAARS